MMNNIIEYLNKIIPNPKCELNYNKDYELLIATMLSAQTTDKRVNEVTKILFKEYDSIEKLKNADVDSIKKIIMPLGTYNVKARNIISIANQLFQKKGKIPNDRTYLESLPGVGRKTANVVLNNLFNEPCIAVDTHVARVSKRLGLAKQEDNVQTIEQKLTQKIPKDNLCRMHHQLVLFGRYYCTSKNPKCEICELKKICKYQKTK